MNFLTHSLISLEIDTQTKQQTLYGNFAGDFYKGLIPHLNLADNLKSGVCYTARLIRFRTDRTASQPNYSKAHSGVIKALCRIL